MAKHKHKHNIFQVTSTIVKTTRMIVLVLLTIMIRSILELKMSHRKIHNVMTILTLLEISTKKWWSINLDKISSRKLPHSFKTTFIILVVFCNNNGECFNVENKPQKTPSCTYYVFFTCYSNQKQWRSFLNWTSSRIPLNLLNQHNDWNCGFLMMESV